MCLTFLILFLGKKDILKFLQDSDLSVTYKTARIKLTNERVKILKRKNIRLKDMLV
jgi:hypothetical protein